ncbi:phosphoribosylformylglycinamidine synthase subunit PurS [Desmospora profundinema]|uniref:Phosphoribosylformylglycinamidine synthase subunit PurS n=1 Tax=Desmospora profundinema TaxID=1571184 RepID=A0ABU1IM65_9BACL|nr:phosphoribosylformylglycinamidine synthase subunit PurS [Desmospora profundinema]MDR6225866.1 phosphoribosylformylglycinamidine synthase [Desmospora profundinema]
MYKATINVQLKSSVLDPQGSAVKGSLHSLGFEEVENVRIGKTIQVWLDTGDAAAARKQVEEMCQKLLANPVIENYDYQLEEGA